MTAAPPAKKRKPDYLRLIACIPSDRLWKSWENKHLLRSYANGSSFAQIASSNEFSNGLLIRNEVECRAHFEFLHQWQPFQDAELLRAGSCSVDQNFGRTCAERFSKGMVKRSEKQCKERYEFLVKGEFEDLIILEKGMGSWLLVCRWEELIRKAYISVWGSRNWLLSWLEWWSGFEFESEALILQPPGTRCYRDKDGCVVVSSIACVTKITLYKRASTPSQRMLLLCVRNGGPTNESGEL